MFLPSKFNNFFEDNNIDYKEFNEGKMKEKNRMERYNDLIMGIRLKSREVDHVALQLTSFEQDIQTKVKVSFIIFRESTPLLMSVMEQNGLLSLLISSQQ